jgi:outer membrane protein OmpA-like peptidoglycan-associated protein
MKKLFLLSLLVNSFSLFSQQSYTGYSSDNYNGYTGSYTQPAAIVNSLSRFSFTSSLMSVASNNFIGANASTISRLFGNQKLKYREPRYNGYQMQHVSIDLFGAYLELNHKNAIGYSFRIREFANIDGLSNPWTKAIYSDFDSTKQMNGPVSFDHFNFNQFIYTEHRFSYARVIMEGSEHFLKAGAAFKLLNGVDASYLYSEKGSFTFSNSDNGMSDFNGTKFEYGRAEKNKMFTSRKLGVGFDLGAVYEFRRDFAKFKYDMDGQTDIERYDKNKYLFKIGVSIIDIGRVKYSKDPASYNFTANSTPIDAKRISNFDINLQDIQKPSLIKKFDDIDSTANKSASQEAKFKMNLPTSFNVQVDYHIWKNFYANYTTSLPLKSKRDPSKSHLKAIQSITPRYEHVKYSVMLPITLQRNGQLNLGVAGRYQLHGGKLGVFAGANNITNVIGKRAKYTQNLFFGLVYNIGYTVPSDVDGDQVSDEKDACKYDKGLLQYNGCPDTDGDGIIDSRDYCIYHAGPIEQDGCPDKDGDGIIDVNDQCPDDVGLPIHYGCPDSDKDGIIDLVDQCPTIPGIEFNNGCPFVNPGCCTDNDGDGVTNKVDNCPEISGSIYNNGCPINETNIDTIGLYKLKERIDPNNTITAAEVIKNEQTIAVQKEAFETEVFETESVKKQTEVERLDILFKYDDANTSGVYDVKIKNFVEKYKLDKLGQYQIQIIGHTDNDGKDNYNLILSKKRAEVVKRKLMDLGVSEKTIKVDYYGENKPVRSNSNNENKQFNRRVEIILIKIN